MSLQTSPWRPHPGPVGGLVCPSSLKWKEVFPLWHSLTPGSFWTVHCWVKFKLHCYHLFTNTY